MQASSDPTVPAPRALPPREPVLLLFGGASGERRVSVATAQHLAERLALPDDALWFVAPDGSVAPTTRAELRAFDRPFERDFAPAAPPLAGSLAEALARFSSAPLEAPVFLLGFHGGEGEDGTVQALLEARGLAFTGSDARASALAMHKASAKETVARHGVRVAAARTLAGLDEASALAALRAFFAQHGRCVAKPVSDGSSVGLFHVRSEGDCEVVARALAERRAVPYLLEQFVRGPELTVGVFDDPARGPRALPASEVRLDDGRVFDFEGKYLGHGTTELTPAQVPEAVSAAAQALAVAAHTALGCAGYSRTDVIASDDGPVFLETNTLPGMTRASFFPQQLACAGVPLEGFFAALVAQARARQRAPRSAG